MRYMRSEFRIILPETTSCARKLWSFGKSLPSFMSFGRKKLNCSNYLMNRKRASWILIPNALMGHHEKGGVDAGRQPADFSVAVPAWNLIGSPICILRSDWWTSQRKKMLSPMGHHEKRGVDAGRQPAHVSVAVPGLSLVPLFASSVLIGEPLKDRKC